MLGDQLSNAKHQCSPCNKQGLTHAWACCAITNCVSKQGRLTVWNVRIGGFAIRLEQLHSDPPRHQEIPCIVFGLHVDYVLEILLGMFGMVIKASGACGTSISAGQLRLLLQQSTISPTFGLSQAAQEERQCQHHEPKLSPGYQLMLTSHPCQEEFADPPLLSFWSLCNSDK